MRDGGTAIAQYLFEMPPTSELYLVRAARPGVHDSTFLSLNYILFCYPSSRSSFCSVLCHSFYICYISNPLEYFTRYSRSDCSLIPPPSKLQVIALFLVTLKSFNIGRRYWLPHTAREPCAFLRAPTVTCQPFCLSVRGQRVFCSDF